ncbi:transposase [Sedimenticola selenatireducens]|uniref:transposase n=1 Tax=Sedimenticola selenatireducens TaxID=191960 RepID=UPI002AAB352D|nr:transposase [Sedimenticola selenatireducens]
MGQTKKRNYDRYTLEFKHQAVKLANHPKVIAKDIAESLGIHPVMLYRWRMEYKNGELRENKHMKSKKVSPKRQEKRTDPLVEKEAELAKANKRIKELERALENRTEELDLLKKAKRFFEKTKR